MKKCLFILISLWPVIAAKAQHSALYSQYMVNALAINPGYAGSREVLSASLLYRDQWTGIDGAPTTQTISAHTPLKKRVGLGLLVYNDKIGVTRKMGAALSYAYRLPVGKGKLAMGISAQMLSISSRWSQVNTGETSDPVYMNDEKPFYSPNAGAGIYYRNPKLYAGLSAPELFSNSAGHNYFSGSNLNLLLTAGVITTLSSTVKFKPSILLKYHKASPFQLDVNTSFYFRELLELGLSWRSGDALVGLVQLNITPQLRVGYSYDRSISRLSSYNNGSHEIILQYEFRYKTSAVSPRYF